MTEFLIVLSACIPLFFLKKKNKLKHTYMNYGPIIPDIQVQLRHTYPSILEMHTIGTCPQNYSCKQLYNTNDEPEIIYQHLMESMNIQKL